MKLRIQKRLAAGVLNTSQSNIRFDESRLEDIKESITKIDIKSLIKDKAIWAKEKPGASRGRARKRQLQRSKGKRKGQGSRKGRATSRNPRKRLWVAHVRKQRDLIKTLKEKGILSKEGHSSLYKKIKGGFFRSERHLKGYINEKGFAKAKKAD